MMIDILSCNRRQVFSNLLERYKKINEQDDIVRESKVVEYTPSKLYENKARDCKSHQGHHYQL